LDFRSGFYRKEIEDFINQGSLCDRKMAVF
jgi:hypothetical protein